MSLSLDEARKVEEIIGEENIRKILSDKLIIKLSEAKDSQFFSNGVWVGNNKDVNVILEERTLMPGFKKEDCLEGISVLKEFLESKRSFLKIPSAEDFSERVKMVYKRINKNPKIKKVLNGDNLPVVIPQVPRSLSFHEYLNELLRLAGPKITGFKEELNLLKASVEPLKEKLKTGPIVGIYFKNALLWMSGEASVEVAKSLPGFQVSGLDIIMAVMMYPKHNWERITHYCNKKSNMLALGTFYTDDDPDYGDYCCVETCQLLYSGLFFPE